ncbi:MAG TPA: porin family protein [Gemmatimonadaceae bacterium]|jgi:hypothetical protein
MKKVLPLLALVLCATAAHAQSAATPARFEVMAGANFATLSESEGADMRTGLVAGIGMIKPISAGWAFQPELTYSMKGAKTSESGVTGTVKLSYLEVPLLLRYEVEGGEVRPFFHAGPALALKLSCDVEASSGSATASESCSDAGADAKSFDIGLMFGGGLAFKQMNHTFSVGVRYNLGLVDIADNSTSKNRVLSVVGTFEWPWGK